MGRFSLEHGMDTHRVLHHDEFLTWLTTAEAIELRDLLVKEFPPEPVSGACSNCGDPTTTKQYPNGTWLCADGGACIARELNRKFPPEPVQVAYGMNDLPASARDSVVATAIMEAAAAAPFVKPAQEEPPLCGRIFGRSATNDAGWMCEREHGHDGRCAVPRFGTVEPAQEEPTPQPDPRCQCNQDAPFGCPVHAQPDPDEVRLLLEMGRDLNDGREDAISAAASAWLRDREHSCEETVRARHYPGEQQPATPAQATADKPLSIEAVIAAHGDEGWRMEIGKGEFGSEHEHLWIAQVVRGEDSYGPQAKASTPEAAIQALGEDALEKIRERVARDSETLRKCGGES